MATKHEKAVLRAAKARMRRLMKDYGYRSYEEVIRRQRGQKTVAAKLIRATARWLIATT